MSFFSRLFKAKQPETLEQKIANLDNLEQQQLLACLSANEPEAYHCAVVSKLNYSPQLLSVAVQTDAGAQLKTAARKRIGELLDADAVTVATVSEGTKDQSVLLQICGYSNQAGLALVDSIDQQDLLLEVALTGSTTQIRQAAAQKIHHRPTLEALYKQGKSKDKSVYKIAKTKLDVFKEQRAAEERIAQEVDALCHQAEQLSKRPLDEIFSARKAQIESAWEDLSGQASEPAQERYAVALKRCEEKLHQEAARQEAEAQQRAAANEAKKDVHALLHAWQNLLARLYDQPLEPGVEAEIEQLQERQERVLGDAADKGIDTDKESRHADHLQKSTRALLEKLREHGPLPELIGQLENASEQTGSEINKRLQQLVSYAKHLRDVEAPAIIRSSEQAVEQWQQQIKQQSAQRKQQLRATTDLIRRGDWAVAKGHVGRARAILRDLENAIGNINELPSHIEAKYEEFKTSIDKLGDWHEFAVTPKKEALVEQMQALVGSELPPPQLADKIQQLQEQWKELCRGGQNQDEHLWQEFHAASQEAYQPCKVYFEEQTQQREQNAEERRTLLSQLEQYRDAYDWDNADWKEVEKTLRIAREAWQSHWPVPRKEIKPLQEQFEGLMDQLYGKLKAEQERNRIKKQAIVEQAAKLPELADVQEAIESAKKLQAQWQSIGQCKRKDDQALWKQFRTHCDAVFEKRSQENEAQKEERERAKTQAIELLEQLEALVDFDTEQFLSARPDIDRLSDEFKNLGELPRADSKLLFERYNNITEMLQAKTQRERLALVEQQWRAVFKLADQLREAERGHIEQGDAVDSVAQVQQASNDIQSWPGNSRDIIETRISMAATLTEAHADEAENQLRRLCIRSEIINGNETPGEDKTLRMQLQVELMQNEGFGQSNALAREQDMQQLLEQWLSQPGCKEPPYHALLRRFSHTWGLHLS